MRTDQRCECCGDPAHVRLAFYRDGVRVGIFLVCALCAVDERLAAQRNGEKVAELTLEAWDAYVGTVTA